MVANGEFFLLLLPDGGRLVHPIAMGERFPLNFGREVIFSTLHVHVHMPDAALLHHSVVGKAKVSLHIVLFPKTSKRQSDQA